MATRLDPNDSIAIQKFCEIYDGNGYRVFLQTQEQQQGSDGTITVVRPFILVIMSECSVRARFYGDFFAASS